MSTSIKLKPIHCDHIALHALVKRDNLDLKALYSNLASVLPRGGKTLKTQVDIFAPIDSANAESDSHLHLTVRDSGGGDSPLDVGLDLVTLSHPHPAKHGASVTIENIGTWLGECVKGDLLGAGHASFVFKGSHFKPAISLPYSGVIPIDSSVIRKPSIAGLDVEVGESDIGLRRFFMYKADQDTIALSIIFAFGHTANFGLFAKLMERATDISSVLVTREKQ